MRRTNRTNTSAVLGAGSCIRFEVQNLHKGMPKLPFIADKRRI